MAEVLAGGGGGGLCEGESEAELSQSLARTKTRSYGSTGTATAPPAGSYRQHRVSGTDTLQGLALRYGVTMEQIKRANKLFTSDCIFLKKTLIIPVVSEKALPFNGLNSLDSPENDESAEERNSLGAARPAAGADEDSSSSSSPEDPATRPAQPEELSAKDFLQRLDLQIKRSTEAAAKNLQEDDTGTVDSEQEENLYASSSYHNQS